MLISNHSTDYSFDEIHELTDLGVVRRGISRNTEPFRQISQINLDPDPPCGGYSMTFHLFFCPDFIIPLGSGELLTKIACRSVH